MNIIVNSKPGKALVSLILNMVLKHKLGYNLKLELNDFDMIDDEKGNVRLHLDLDANASRDELFKIFKEYI